MADFNIQELREMEKEELEMTLNDLKKELVREKGQIEVGGFADNPGEISDMKKTIARIKTVLNERASN